MEDRLRRMYTRHHRRQNHNTYDFRRFFGRTYRNHSKNRKMKWFILILAIIIALIICISTGYRRKLEADSRKTIGNLLLTALEPVGYTMYIWGGGWDDEDTD